MSLTNHQLLRLSDRDLEMIKYIRQGGNWMDIPEHIPSQRLKQIREMTKVRGIVRTTYYGRLRPDQPAYTVSTYFNRPGNGTNIHPWENRTISAREAARLQSFPDSFNFLGSQGSIRKQIGNAVPPLAAMAIGKMIGKQAFVDLFAGAGGLSYGLEMAGLTCIAGQDIVPEFMNTFKINHSKNAETIIGDIRQKKVQDSILEILKLKLKGGPLGLLVGGPPCQGFSTAGWRQHDDDRNALVGYFLRMAEKIKPENIIIENVEGLLSMEEGAVMKNIHNILNDLGYIFHELPLIIRTEEYGVPQMRKRIFIIATRKVNSLPDLPIKYFDRCLGRREGIEHRTNPKLAYPITVGEAFLGLPQLIHDTIQIEKTKKFPIHFSDWSKGIISTEQFLNLRGKKEK